MIKNRYPKKGEIVIGKVVRVTPYSALINLLEYNASGMVHISEISSGWIKDIRHHIKKGDIVVAKVMNLDRSYISLSIKRVNKNQRAEKIKEFNLEKRARKMLSIISKDLKGYENVMKTINENFGNIYKAFELSTKDINILVRKGIPLEWAEKMRDIYRRNVKQKTFDFKCIVKVSTDAPDGIKKIKSILNCIEKMKTEVIYISSPEYLVRFQTKDPKEGEKKLNKIINKFPSFLSKYKCTGSISRV